jgi:hypothetical protein
MSFLLAARPYLVAGQNATEIYDVTGTGSFHYQRATINGRYAYAAYNALADGTVRFVGTLRSPFYKARPTLPRYTDSRLTQEPTGLSLARRVSARISEKGQPHH